MGEMRNAHQILVGKPEGKGPPGRLWRRWESNVRLHIIEIDWEGVDWIHPAQDSNQWRDLMNSVMHLPAPINGESFFD
jgi:hypothetical protein